MEYKWVMIANCIIWLSTAAGAIAGLMITKNANCLWVFLIPALSGYTKKKER